MSPYTVVILWTGCAHSAGLSRRPGGPRRPTRALALNVNATCPRPQRVPDFSTVSTWVRSDTQP